MLGREMVSRVTCRRLLRVVGKLDKPEGPLVLVRVSIVLNGSVDIYVVWSSPALMWPLNLGGISMYWWICARICRAVNTVKILPGRKLLQVTQTPTSCWNYTVALQQQSFLKLPSGWEAERVIIRQLLQVNKKATRWEWSKKRKQSVSALEGWQSNVDEDVCSCD